MSPEVTPAVTDRATLAEMRARDFEALGFAAAAQAWRRVQACRLAREGFDAIDVAVIADTVALNIGSFTHEIDGLLSE